MASIQSLHKTLVDEWGKPNKNLNTVEQLLQQLKALLFDVQVVSSLDEKASNTIHSDVFEISALVAVLKADMDAFEDAILQVISFYELKPEASNNKYLMIGLNLMFLLAVGNRLSDFHMLLEQIPQQIQINDPYIVTPVRLEQSLMEGAYNKIVLTEKNIPSPYFAVFVRIMMDAVRRNIATSIEKSFKMLSVKDATTRLLFENDNQTVEFAKQRSWKVDGNSFVFECETPVNDQELDTTSIAKQLIFYAKQLEMIV